MVINAAVSAADSTPVCPSLTQAITQLLIASLTALIACSTVFVVIGAKNNACCVLSDTVTLPPSAASSMMWLAGVDGVASVDGVKYCMTDYSQNIGVYCSLLSHERLMQQRRLTCRLDRLDKLGRHGFIARWAGFCWAGPDFRQDRVNDYV